MKLPNLKPRLRDAHKGCFGSALIIGGSRGMVGAAALAGSSATLAGAGRVTLVVPDRCLEVAACFNPNYMTIGLPDDENGQFAREAEMELRDVVPKFTNIGVGPGMGRSDACTHLVASLYERFKGPLVVDADGLNALSDVRDRIYSHSGVRVLTPHIGEFRRLVGEELSTDECRSQAKSFAKQNDVILVLKGHQSIVTDGNEEYINTTGNPGMATGGSGDVLTGTITALLGQDYSPLDAVVLGVHAHGLAGDFASKKFGQISVVASHISDCLSDAFQAMLR